MKETSLLMEAQGMQWLGKEKRGRTRNGIYTREILGFLCHYDGLYLCMFIERLTKRQILWLNKGWIWVQMLSSNILLLISKGVKNMSLILSWLHSFCFILYFN